MKRSPELVTLTRREVCEGLVACLGALVIAGCSGSDSATPDAATDSSGGGPSCGASPFDVGAPAMFTLNKPVYVQSKNVFIVRDPNGLYALTARCTHQGVTITAHTTNFYCSGHGATFDFNGLVTRGPATQPLQHYAMCMLPNGNVGVDTTVKVDKTVRLTA